MTTKANTKDLTCCLCGQIYSDPILLSPCGHSFDRQCILRYTACPIGFCNAPVFENSLLPNDIVKKLVDGYYQSSNSTYELFLLDTSTSMWYSDYYFGLLGTSRFRMATKFLTNIFEQRWNSTTNQISLVTFDTNPLEQFPFETARQHHLQVLEKLQPNGLYTALFDAIKFCLEKFERLNQITTRCIAQSLYILTDGGDNFSSSGNEKQYINYIKGHSRKLNIVGHIIQVGDKNLQSTKQLCDQIDYRFHHFNNGNTPQFVKSFLLSSNDLEQKLNALPDPCTTPVRLISNTRKTAVLA